MLVQARGEAIGAILSMVLVSLPWLEAELKAATGGAGRRSVSAAIDGAQEMFLLEPTLSKGISKELAWATFSGIRNTNACSLLVVRRGVLQVVRGAWASDAGGGAATMGSERPDVRALQREVSDASECVQALLDRSQRSPVYLATKAEVESELAMLRLLPAGAASALLVPLGASHDDYLLALSERERGLGRKDRVWLASLADKIVTLP